MRKPLWLLAAMLSTTVAEINYPGGFVESGLQCVDICEDVPNVPHCNDPEDEECTHKSNSPGKSSLLTSFVVEYAV